MTPAFQDWVDRAKSVKIETILHARNVKLKGYGVNLAGPCPNCGGTDRFAVHTGKQQFHCRGCGGSGGGAISLVRFIDGGSFLQAVETITGEPKPDDKSAPRKASKGKQLGKLVKLYDYTDEIGNLIFQVMRYEPKDFRQRRPDPENMGEWILNLQTVRLVPYRLSMLIEAIALDQTIYIVEGEKDADTGVERLGIIATTTAMGAGKWKGDQGERYAEFFHGADVVIIPDNDLDPRKGRAHASMIAGKLRNIAERVRVLALPHGYKDLTEWTDAIGTREELDRLTEATPEYVNGHDPGAAPDDAQVIPIISKRDFLLGFLPPDYLIDGMMQYGFIYAITGQTGHAKTAVALLIAELVASNDPNAMFGGNKVEKGRVVYFAGENPDDVRMRVIGADHVRRNNGEDPSQDQIWFVPGQFNIPQMRNYLIERFSTMGGVNLIIIDTSAAYFLGKDEIDNVEMGAHARMLRTLTALPGNPCVIPLCHPIKRVESADQLLPRGGGAFLNEVDGNLTLFKKTDDTVELDYTKMRGAGFEPIQFKLERIDPPTLVDKKGRKIPTIRAQAITEVQAQAIKRTTRDFENKVLRAYLSNPDVTHAEICTMNDWLDRSQKPLKSRVTRVLGALAKIGYVRKQRDDEWFLTEKGKEEARKVALAARAASEPPQQGRML
jgi:hypothetical protein